MDSKQAKRVLLGSALAAAAVAAVGPSGQTTGQTQVQARAETAQAQQTQVNKTAPAPHRSSVSDLVKAAARRGHRYVGPRRHYLLKNKPTRAQILRAAKKRRNIRARSKMARKG